LQHANLSAASTHSIRDGLSSLHDRFQGVLKLGTSLSGTDVAVHAAQCMANFWRSVFGLDFTIQHEFSCDNDDSAQKFIAAFWSPNIVFPDVTELDRPHAKDVNGKLQAVPHVNIYISSIECDSISSLNRNAASNRDCVQKVAGKTGTTARGVLGYVHTHKPDFVIIEEVKGFSIKGPSGQSNLDCLVKELNTDGYEVWFSTLTPNRYGFPQSRPRLWIVASRTRSACSPDQTVANVQPPDWCKRSDRQVLEMRIATLQLPHFLLDPEELPCVNEAPPAAEKMQTKKAGSQAAYEVEHLESYEREGMSWPPEDVSTQPQSLPVRAKELIHFWRKKLQVVAAPSHGIYIVDTNLSLSWGTPSLEHTPCIASSSVMYGIEKSEDTAVAASHKFDRRLSGEELLALQGFSFEFQKKGSGVLGTLTYAQKVTLAGNAFCAAVLPAVFALLPLAQNSWKASSQLPPVVSADDTNKGGDDDGDDADDGAVLHLHHGGEEGEESDCLCDEDVESFSS
jgi:site-specific DNA-cytosine methylase